MLARLRLSYMPVIGPVLRSLQFVPRRQELRHPRTYRRAAALHGRLRDEGYTITAKRYGRALYRLAEEVEREGVPGAIVDCGVWNGGSTILMSLGAPSRRAWAFDSFEGMPEPRPELDGEASRDYVGYAKGSEEKLREGFRAYSDPAKLSTAKGWFEETFPRHAGEIDRIALLHIDADWYESVMLALETFYPKVSPGGYVVIDDYKVWAGARTAVDEFRERERITAPMVASHYWRVPAGAGAAGNGARSPSETETATPR